MIGRMNLSVNLIDLGIRENDVQTEVLFGGYPALIGTANIVLPMHSDILFDSTEYYDSISKGIWSCVIAFAFLCRRRWRDVPRRIQSVTSPIIFDSSP